MPERRSAEPGDRPMEGLRCPARHARQKCWSRRALRSVRIERQAMAHELVFINGGQRGLQVRLKPGDAAAVLNAIVAPLVA